MPGEGVSNIKRHSGTIAQRHWVSLSYQKGIMKIFYLKMELFRGKRVVLFVVASILNEGQRYPL
jgi:hypothetical protein